MIPSSGLSKTGIILGRDHTFGRTGVIDEKGRRSYARHARGIDQDGNDPRDFPGTLLGKSPLSQRVGVDTMPEGGEI